MDNIYTLGTSKWRIWVTSRINDLYKEDSYSKEELDAIFESLRARDISVAVSFSNLPDASVSGGLFYWCSQSEGTKWLPGSLGGTFRNSGLYYCNSVNWEFISSPFQATQQEVDAGVAADRFVTPYTLDGFSKWATKSNSDHAHTGIYQPSGTYSTDIHSNIVALNSVSNINTGDNATNSQYSGLATSKQDLLVSGTNIKTINGVGLLGSGDLSVTSVTNLTTSQSSTNVIINSDTGTDGVIALGNGVNAGVSLNDYTTVEKTKLSGIATGATVNSSDTTLLNRSNHTGTQLSSTISDFNTQIAANALLKTNNLSDLANVVTAKTNLSLQNVDNTSDINKPISTATQTSLNLKANLLSPTFTGTVSGITATMVGAPNGSGNSTGINTGDNAVNTLYSGLVSNATHTGDVTGATALIIANNVVSNAKLAQMGANTFKANNTGSAANATDITVAQAKILLAISNTDVSGLGTLSTQSGTFTSIPQANITNLTTDLASKQATLVSATNIKTINGNSLLGSGDLIISGGGSSNLNGLTDVIITTPINGQTLSYNGVNWVNNTPSGGGSVLSFQEVMRLKIILNNG